MAIITIRDGEHLSYMLAAPNPLPADWKDLKVIEGLPGNYEKALDAYDSTGYLKSLVQADFLAPSSELFKARVRDIEAGSGTANVDLEAKRQEVVAKYAAAIVTGYDTGLGFSLKLGEQDQRVLFDYQQRLLRQLSKDPPEVTLATIKPIMGTDGNWHMVTVEQFIDAVDGGAGHIESLNGAYAGYAAMLAQGVTDFVVDFAQ